MFIIRKLLTVRLRAAFHANWTREPNQNESVLFLMSAILKRVNVGCRVSNKWFWPSSVAILSYFIWIWGEHFDYMAKKKDLYCFYSYAYTDYLNVTCKIWHMWTFECVEFNIIYSYLRRRWRKKGQRAKQNQQ